MAALGFTVPTPVQEQVIPLALAGSDLIVQAETGSGKTLAFGLPLLSLLEPGQRPQALVVAPTRELAEQVHGAIATAGRGSALRVLAVYGGMRIEPQEAALRRGTDIVVGTPGRLKDLMGRRSLDLGGIRHLILDEADLMLDMGFRPDIEWLIARTPASRQTLVFSATMPAAIQAIAALHMRLPRVVRLARVGPTPEAIGHYFARVPRSDRVDALLSLLESERPERVLVFTAMKHETRRLARRIGCETGWPAGFLNGNMSQNARNTALDRFRSGANPIMVATDVAARGLDIDGLTHVFHFSVPATVEAYVHRSGRTGRAGNAGKTITLVSPEMEADFGAIRRKIAVQEIVLTPGGQPVMAPGGQSVMARPNGREPFLESETELTGRVPAQGAPGRAGDTPARRLSGSRQRALRRQRLAGG